MAISLVQKSSPGKLHFRCSWDFELLELEAEAKENGTGIDDEIIFKEETKRVYPR